MDIVTLGIIVAAIIGFLVFVGLLLGRLYSRATREVSLVKTGAGGKRVIMDGGTIVVPLLHKISPVNMKTLRLEVARNAETTQPISARRARPASPTATNAPTG